MKKDPIEERIAPYLKAGWTVELRTPTRCHLRKRYDYPRTDRTNEIWIEDGYYGKVLYHQPALCPQSCERCGRAQKGGPSFHSVTLRDEGYEAIRVCDECLKPEDSCAIVEWGWTSQTMIEPKSPAYSLPETSALYEDKRKISDEAYGALIDAANTPYNSPQGGSQMLQTISEIKEDNKKVIKKAEQANRLIDSIDQLEDLKIDLPAKVIQGKVVDYGYINFSKTCITLSEHFNSQEFEDLLIEMNDAVSKVVKKKIAALKAKVEPASH